MGKNIHVTKRPDGNWQAIKEGNSRASCVAKTQEQRSISIAPHPHTPWCGGEELTE